MPRQSKGIRLYLKPASRDHAAVWIIRDGARSTSTRCGAGDRQQAEIALADYIASRHQAPRRERRLFEIGLADVIAIYAQDVAPKKANPERIGARLERLLYFWGRMTLADVTGASCRAYVASRGNSGGARRDLQDLSAAIGYHHSEGFHRETVLVPLPAKGGRRERWLTRDEIASLVFAAWRMREQQRRDRVDTRSERFPTAKRTGRHLARAILFSYYTASRPGDSLRASWHAGSGRSFVDLDRGVFYRLPEDKQATNKRQPPVRLNPKLLAHLRRWKDKRVSLSYVCEWEGLPVKSIKTALARAVQSAGLGQGVTIYTLRHSRITHLMQQGVPKWEVAGLAGTSEAMIEKHYGHHHEDHMKEAVNAR